MKIRTCESLDEVRTEIDSIDQAIVRLIAERGEYVSQAARFKGSTTDVKAPQRVEQVIAKVLPRRTSVEPNERLWRLYTAR